MNTGKQTSIAHKESRQPAFSRSGEWTLFGGLWPVSWQTDKEHYVQRGMCSLPKGENRSSTVLLPLTHRELVLLAAGQAGPSLHNDKHVFAGTTKNATIGARLTPLRQWWTSSHKGMSRAQTGPHCTSTLTAGVLTAGQHHSTASTLSTDTWWLAGTHSCRSDLLTSFCFVIESQVVNLPSY